MSRPRARSYSPSRHRDLNLNSGIALMEKMIMVQKELDDIVAIYNNGSGDDNSYIDQNGEIKRRCVASMCRAALVFEPHIRHKMTELIYTHTFDRRNPMAKYHVHEQPNGPDIYDAAGNNYEHKLSILKTEFGSAMFNWPIPRPQDTNMRREELIESIKRKVSPDGKAIFEIMYRGEIIEHYEFGQAFLVGFFRLANIGGPHNATYNIRSLRCKICKKFHRFSIMQKFADDFYKHPNIDLADEFFMDSNRYLNNCEDATQILSGPCVICHEYHDDKYLSS
jgi:hypothetical protein